MLTVLVQAGQREAPALQVTLSALIAGALDGLVREVVVVGASDEDVRRLAEHAGCRMADLSELRQAMTTARGEWLLLMKAGCEPASGWTDAVWRHVESAGAGPARFAPAVGLFSRLLAMRREPLASAVLAPRALLVERGGGAGDLEALARSVRTRPIPARIAPPRR